MINHIGTIESSRGDIDFFAFTKNWIEYVQIVQGIGSENGISQLLLTKEEAERLVQKLSEDFI